MLWQLFAHLICNDIYSLFDTLSLFHLLTLPVRAPRRSTSTASFIAWITIINTCTALSPKCGMTPILTIHSVSCSQLAWTAEKTIPLRDNTSTLVHAPWREILFPAFASRAKNRCPEIFPPLSAPMIGSTRNCMCKHHCEDREEKLTWTALNLDVGPTLLCGTQKAMAEMRSHSNLPRFSGYSNQLSTTRARSVAPAYIPDHRPKYRHSWIICLCPTMCAGSWACRCP